MLAVLVSIVCYVTGISSLVTFFAYIQFALNQTDFSFSWMAVYKNLAIFLIFPLQHSVLARPGVKARVQAVSGPLMERPIYVGTSGVAMFFVLYFWRPFGPVLYRLPHALAFDIVVYFCLLLLVVTTVQMGHTTMFGLSQGFAVWRKTSLPEGGLKTTGVFRVIRHPLTSLLLVVLWSHNEMTASRLEFNVLFTVYALIGTVFEERDLVKRFGDDYLQYRKKVPAFIPFLP